MNRRNFLLTVTAAAAPTAIAHAANDPSAPRPIEQAEPRPAKPESGRRPDFGPLPVMQSGLWRPGRF